MHPLECAACSAAAGGTCCFLTCLIRNTAKTMEVMEILCCISPASGSISSRAQTTTEERPGIDSVVELRGSNSVDLAIIIPITQNSESAAAASVAHVEDGASQQRISEEQAAAASEAHVEDGASQQRTSEDQAAAASEAQSSSSRRVVRPQISVQGLSYGFPFSDLIRNIKNCVIRSYSKHCCAGVKTSLNPTQRGALQDALTANGVNTDNITDDKLDAIQLALHSFLSTEQNIEVVLSDPSELKKLIEKYMLALRLNQVQIEF